MMKKIVLKLVLCVAVMLCAASMTSCSKKDKKALLECVPANTAGLAFMDASQILDQLGIKAEDNDVKYGPEIKEFLEEIGADRKEKENIKEALNLVCQTEKTVMAFEYDELIYLTFYVDDQKKFIETLEEIDKLGQSFSEESGYMTSDDMAVKDDQVWFCFDVKEGEQVVDPEAIDKMLDSKKKFVEEYDKITESFLAEDVYYGLFIDINTVKGFINGYDAERFAMVQSMAFDDASYLVCTAKLTDNGGSSEMRVLNSKMEAAKFNFPLAKIDANSLKYIDGSAPVIAALGIDPATVNKIVDLGEKYGLFSDSDKMMLNAISELKGTIALSWTDVNNAALSINFSNPEAAKQAGQFMANNAGNDFLKFSYAGNALIARTPDAPLTSGGKVPAALVGQYAGIYVDYSKYAYVPEIKTLGIDKMGTMYVVIGPDGDGIKLTSAWEVKKPVKAMVQTMLQFQKNMYDIDPDELLYLLPVPRGGYDEIPADTMAFEEEYMLADSAVVYEEPAVEVAAEEVATEVVGY
ncbi:MAG: hypothetical protein NC402_01170 [Prevotella sp.]|nr:hypothetical protein [Prevotella sp.]MCM1074472.1 hypothetical protein [Ruminococcus sp.]